MNLRFLETFVWVARLKSFRLTAEKLFSTQASISSRIAALEDELGTRLFLRDSKGVSLTPEGQKVLEYAERMIDTMQALKQSISDTGNIQGRIRVGAMDTVIHTWLSPFVTKLMERYPAVEIELTADTARNLSEQLQKGYLDIIFQTDMVHGDSVRNLELASFPVQWIVPTGSLYDRDYGSMDELARERIITFSRNSRPHQDILNLLHAGNVSAPRISCVNSVAAMTRLIRDGFGIGALPAALVSEEIKRDVLTILQGVPQPSPLNVVATWRTGVGLELSEDIIALACEVLVEYGEQMGERMMSLATPVSEQKTATA
ncbi:LysR family transcriptional regulator [Pseudomonas sp.]|uniref:LysR family transcriptional regulator n=1 Tax=Pseudomonas sp. TaxID=306 RepID=UPI003D0B61B1